MSDYSTDTFAWAREQADLLRRLAAGERVNDQLDWGNVIEEVEAVGRSELRAATSPLWRAMQHKLYLLGWPGNLSARHWRAEAEDRLAEAADEFRESMRKDVDLEKLYRRARLSALRHMDDPPSVPLPDLCPWTLDELLAEGGAA
jgi:Domain of unknown function DUF29